VIIINWVFGIVVFAIGAVNVFWGNDTGFGILIILLSLTYFPPTNTFIRKKFGFSIPWIAKVILGVLILWAALGVGELADKIQLMRLDF